MDAINQPLLSIRDLSVVFRQQGKESVAVDRVSLELCRSLVTDRKELAAMRHK